jgi:MFS family permease
VIVKRFLLSRLCSAIGDQFILFAIPLIVYRSTGSIALSGAAFFIEWVPHVISLPVAGALADRFGGGRIYGGADTVRAGAGFLAFALAIAYPTHIFAVVVALSVVCAVFYAQAFIALEATVPLLVTPEEMPQAQSVLQGIEQTAAVVGPLLAAVAVVVVPPIGLLAAAGSAFATSAIMVWSLRAPLERAYRQVPRKAPAHPLRELLVAFDVLRAHPTLFGLTALSFMVNTIVGLSLATGAALTIGRFMQSNASFGVLQSSVGIFSLASFSAVPALVRKIGVFRMGTGAYAGIVFGGIVMGTARSFPAFVAGFALASGLCGLFNVYIRGERARIIPAEHLGKTIGLIVLLNQCSVPLAGLLVAVTASRLDPRHLFLFASFAALGVLIAVFVALRGSLRISAPTVIASAAMRSSQEISQNFQISSE